MSDQQILGGHYELLEAIGTGPVGTTWRGRDLRDDSERVIKVLRPELITDPGPVARMRGVFGWINRLDHPGIVTVDDIVSLDGWLALVSRLVPGESLHVLLSRFGVVRPTEAALLVAMVCDILAAASTMGIPHGSVKASNILLEPDEEAGLHTVEVTDFGIAALLDDGGVGHDGGDSGSDDDDNARSGAGNLGNGDSHGHGLGLFHSHNHGNAEGQPNGAGNGTGDAADGGDEAKDPFAADIYASGMLLYRMLAGRPPFSARRPGEAVGAHRETEPSPIPGLPDPFWLPVASCLDQNPRNRPTAAELAVLLRDVVPLSAAVPVRAATGTYR